MQNEIRAFAHAKLEQFVSERRACGNDSTEIWLYPSHPPDLANYLDADDSHWRTTARLAITLLRLVATPLDGVSVAPYAIVLKAAKSVRINMRREESAVRGI